MLLRQLHFSAVSDGDFPLSIVWMFNNQPIYLNEKISTVKIGHRVSVLVIKSVAGSHAGSYTYHGENSDGIASYTGQLV